VQPLNAVIQKLVGQLVTYASTNASHASVNVSATGNPMLHQNRVVSRCAAGPDRPAARRQSLRIVPRPAQRYAFRPGELGLQAGEP
jgi:hypothetical protein